MHAGTLRARFGRNQPPNAARETDIFQDGGYVPVNGGAIPTQMLAAGRKQAFPSPLAGLIAPHPVGYIRSESPIIFSPAKLSE
jgi:hypothetical protein